MTIAPYAGRFHCAAFPFVNDVLVMFALMVLNGLFATAPLAIASAKKLRLEKSARQGSAGAQVALDLAARPGDLLFTIEIGITLISISTAPSVKSRWPL